MSIYRPHDTWPDHSKSWWRDTLAYGREQGWSLDHPSGHWGRLFCPGGCIITIFGTGRGGESVAKSARRKIQRCLHVHGSVLARAVDHLDRAEQLTDAASELALRQAHHAYIDEILQSADEALDAIKEAGLLRQIEDLPSEPEIASAAASLDDAGAQLDLATATLSPMSAGVAKPLRRRITALRKRIEKLRTTLDQPVLTVVDIGRGRPGGPS